jgi:hypothetical protein
MAYYVQTVIVLYTAGLLLMFGLTAYLRALGRSVPRWGFLVWPVLVLWLPTYLLLRAHRGLERWLALGIEEDRKRTKKVNMVRIMGRYSSSSTST